MDHSTRRVAAGAGPLLALLALLGLAACGGGGSPTPTIDPTVPTPIAGAAYVCFGRGLGYLGGAWVDVHGAGAQRSDPKVGDPASFPTGHGPQGDAIRIYNGVRLVRDTGVGAAGFPIVDTGQASCYDLENGEMVPPAPGQPLHGQDAQHAGLAPHYTDLGGGMVLDDVTGLIWQASPDTNGDGRIEAVDKLTYAEAQAHCASLTLGGHTDWRLPTIKELYSLIDFGGIDPSGYEGSDTSALTPFIATAAFDFAYGDTAAGERIIDAQYASDTLYVGGGESLLFGVNFADGRIKGYGLTLFGRPKTFFVMAVRGNATYGENDFVDHGDGTISDLATGLMWAQQDAGALLDWEEALAWVDERNAANHLGHGDWRLPNAKELQSLVDYRRSPDSAGSAAIDARFEATSIVNEAGQVDYPAYWTSTSHVGWLQAAR